MQPDSVGLGWSQTERAAVTGRPGEARADLTSALPGASMDRMPIVLTEPSDAAVAAVAARCRPEEDSEEERTESDGVLGRRGPTMPSSCRRTRAGGAKVTQSGLATSTLPTPAVLRWPRSRSRGACIGQEDQVPDVGFQGLPDHSYPALQLIPRT